MENKELPNTLRGKLRKIIELTANVTEEHSNPECIGDVWGHDCVCGKIEDLIDDAVLIMEGKPLKSDSIKN